MRKRIKELTDKAWENNYCNFKPQLQFVSFGRNHDQCFITISLQEFDGYHLDMEKNMII